MQPFLDHIQNFQLNFYNFQLPKLDVNLFFGRFLLLQTLGTLDYQPQQLPQVPHEDLPSEQPATCFLQQSIHIYYLDRLNFLLLMVE